MHTKIQLPMQQENEIQIYSNLNSVDASKVLMHPTNEQIPHSIYKTNNNKASCRVLSTIYNVVYVRHAKNMDCMANLIKKLKIEILIISSSFMIFIVVGFCLLT